MNKYRKWFSCVWHVMEIIWKTCSNLPIICRWDDLLSDDSNVCTEHWYSPERFNDGRVTISARNIFLGSSDTVKFLRMRFFMWDSSLGVLGGIHWYGVISLWVYISLYLYFIWVFIIPGILAVCWAATWRRARSHSHPNHSHSPGGNPALREPVFRHFSDCNPSRQQMVLWYLLFSRRSRDLRKKRKTTDCVEMSVEKEMGRNAWKGTEKTLNRFSRCVERHKRKRAMSASRKKSKLEFTLIRWDMAGGSRLVTRCCRCVTVDVIVMSFPLI